MTFRRSLEVAAGQPFDAAVNLDEGFDSEELDDIHVHLYAQGIDTIIRLAHRGSKDNPSEFGYQADITGWNTISSGGGLGLNVFLHPLEEISE